MNEISRQPGSDDLQFNGRRLAEELSANVERPSETHRPIFFAGGLGYDARRNQVTLNEIQAKGYEVLSSLRDPLPAEVDTGFSIIQNGEIKQVSRKEVLAIAHNPEVELSVANYQQNRADLLVATLESSGIGKTDAIFQSADSLMGLLAAHQRPELFENLVLAYPVLGDAPDMTDKGLVASVVAREALARLRREHRVNRREYSFESRLSRLKAASEARSTKTPTGGSVIYSVGSSKQSPLLHELRQQEGAPGVGILIGTDDIMLSPQRIFDSLLAPEDVDAIMVVNTPHGMNGRGDVLDDTLELLRLTKAEKGRRITNNVHLPLANRLYFGRDVPAEDQRYIAALAQLADERLARD